MNAYLPVAIVAFSIAIYWQFACWQLLKTVETRHPELYVELGNPKFAVPGTPFLSALWRLLFTSCVRRIDPPLYSRILKLRLLVAIGVLSFIALSLLTSVAA
jgi:hypothetical protein